MPSHPSTVRCRATLVVTALVTLLSLAGPGGLTAQTHPNHVQGFDAEKLYQFDRLESVNVFNGNLNLTIPLGSAFPVGGGFAYGLDAVYSGNVWEWEEIAVLGANGYETYLMAIPRKRSNAGLGWLVSLGRMNPPQAAGSVSHNWVYESPDGALHPMNPNLHSDGTKTDDWHYTQDGTYMRFRESTRELELADGTIKTFDSSGRLTRWRDRFGNQIAVTYATNLWTITDSHGRIQKVYFKSAIHYGSVVDRVEVRTFGGTASSYVFEYTDATITRGWSDAYAVEQGYISRTETVPLLTGIALPDGSKFAMPLADYDSGPTTGTSSPSGHLKGMKLPTGGKYEWDWIEYLYPKSSSYLGPRFTTPSSTDLEPFRRSVGLSKRRHENASGGMVGEWTYTPTFDTSESPKEHKVTVSDPVGHPTTYYFSVYADDQDPYTPEPAGWYQYEYGLPFTRNQSDGTSPGRYLSADIKKSGGTTLRKVYLRYEHSNGYANHRVASERTIYVDDGSKTADVTYSDFDGLGHYRTTTTAGTFAAGNVRSSYTAYNPGSCATCQPATTTPWVLGTYTHQTVTEGGVTAKSETCFEAATGFLLRARTLKTGTTAGANDVVVRYTKDIAGNVTAEEHFGGDTQALGTGALCSLSLASPRYRTDHAYQYGSLRSSQYAGQSFKSADFDIDLDTGRVKTSRDSSLLATTYEYDSLGRITYVKPAQEGWTQYVYNVVSGTTPAKVWIYRKSNGGATTLATEEVHFDPFGRVALERRKMADGTLSDRKTVTNALGWPTSRTEWGTTYATSYLGYDPFGRPATISPPEGPVHDVTFTYKGVREVARTVKVGSGWNGTAVTETAATTREIYDRQGRLYQVFEPANPDGTNSTTSYAYDVGGRLKQVTQTAKNPAGTASTQYRYFTYDNRGFLTSERHPEKGASGNGYVYYYSYDAGGNPTRVVDGPSDLTLTYDGAQRVTQVRETGSRTLKAFTYATTNGTGDYRLGKLQVARRYNYPVIGGTTYTVDVAETYTYGGKQGRVSKRDTLVATNGTAGEAFTQSWTWNDLGNPASVTSPRCTHTGCGATTTRTFSSTYTNGFLTGVTGYASAITYHPNGQVNQVTHQNDPANSATWVVDTHVKDPYNRPRPNQIHAKLGTTLVWNSGVYAYDGAANVTKQGNAYFLYDPVSRIKDGLLYLGPGAGGTAVSFNHGYDGFGNLHSLTANTSTRNTPTATTTNRLSGSSVSYDASGNLTSWGVTAPGNGATYQYDRLHMMWNMKNGTEDWLYMYTADDERIWSYKPSTNTSRWTLRDLDAKVLREYQNAGGTWTIQRDYVYRGGQLLAAHTADAAPKDLVQFHLDHLGTTRAVTNKNGARIAYHVYYPFGEEATSPTQDTERMKFTGHERDLANTTSAADDLDYMHARFYNPQTGRFLSVDPGRDFRETVPQSWNRYSYVRNNPLGNVDPDGRVVDTVLDVAFVGYDLFDIGRSLIKGEGVSGTQMAALGADVAGIFVPFGTGGGIAVRALGKVDNLQDIGKLSKVATELSSKSAAREAVTKLGLPAAQETAINKSVGRATSSSTIDILRSGDDVVVNVSRPGRDGQQVIQTVVKPDGSKEVVQLAYNRKGELVHVDPKGGTKPPRK